MSNGLAQIETRPVRPPPPPVASRAKWGKLQKVVSVVGGQRTFRVPRLAWIDTLVLTGVLLIINSLLAPVDIGWLQLQPSPYLLVPILVGCRYGFAAGVLSGFACGAVTLLGQSGMNSTRVLDLLSSQGYFLGALMFAGGVCGEIQHAYQRREKHLSTFNQQLQDRLKKLDNDLALLGETKSELERMLATRDAELSTLDVEIRRLFESSDDLYYNVLLLLNRFGRITGAALYMLGEDGQLSRQALMGPADHLPPELALAGVEMLRLAVQRKTVVTIPEFWQRTHEQPREHLMAAPLLDSGERVMGVIAVTSMPFMALQEKTVHLVSLICRWAARVIELRNAEPGIYRAVDGAPQRVFTPEFFRRNLQLCYASFRQHHLPSTVLLFAVPVPATELQPALESAILPNVRGADFPAQLDLPMPNLAVLLPFSGERGASISVARILANCKRDPAFGRNVKVRVWTFDARHSFEELWDELNSYDQESVDV